MSTHKGYYASCSGRTTQPIWYAVYLFWWNCCVNDRTLDIIGLEGRLYAQGPTGQNGDMKFTQIPY